MSWESTHHIADLPIGQKANMQGNLSINFLGITSGNLATVATAKAAAVAANALKQICDQTIGDQASRGFDIANNMGFTFGSTTAAFTASGPAVFGHQARMITG